MNLSTKITFSRILLGPLFVLAFFFNKKYLSFLILSLNAVLDLLDGYLARKRKEETEFGKKLDPLVDFLFYLLVGFSFSLKGIKEINYFLFPIFLLILAYSIFFFKRKKIIFFHTKTKYFHSPLLYLMVISLIFSFPFAQYIFWFCLFFISLVCFEIFIRSIILAYKL